jgi:uncharacterized protein (DUF697 family)
MAAVTGVLAFAHFSLTNAGQMTTSLATSTATNSNGRNLQAMMYETNL